MGHIFWEERAGSHDKPHCASYCAAAVDKGTPRIDQSFLHVRITAIKITDKCWRSTT